ncbi:LAMI_0G13212g1_1 [Lachancea mirantina]|uniref:LAMI_0G13212g1_1 n=1 Tax=Lachancea mirantina TaxID=1230905 RepID=A0A1G4KBL3_9SACH|nr:LAMI_0G13212g1_1 [Lachancea mirantina]
MNDVVKSGSGTRHWLIFKEFVRIHRKELVKTYLFVPIGVLLTLCILYGVDRLIKNVIKIVFPASVAVMLVNLMIMCLLSWWRRSYAEWYVKIIDVPLSWSLRWMNLFFTPAFVTLILSQWISLREAMLIVAVFVLGYLATFIFLGYFTVLCQKVFGGRKFLSIFVRQEELENGMEMGSSFAPKRRTSCIYQRRGSADSNISTESSETDSDRQSSVRSRADQGFTALSDIASNEGIVQCHEQAKMKEEADAMEGLPEQHIGSDFEMIESPLLRPSKLRVPQRSLFGGKPSTTVTSDEQASPVICQRAITRQVSSHIDHLFSINMWYNHLHHVLYGLGFVASIFSYYFSWYVMPFQLFTAIITFMFIVSAPLVPNPKYKKFLHPVICSVALTWLVLLISVMIKHQKISYFPSELRDYKTGRTYLKLFDSSSYGGHEWPGAGDVFTSCMDVAIVGLSMPMYTYRHDLRKHCLSMLPPIFLLCAASLILYPLICYHIGISKEMAIGFTGRSITLALGTPTIENLNGSVTIMAVTTVVSGIVGVLTGGSLLDLMRIPESDYVTRGLTLGCNCGAIATAYLLGVDRRAAAISTLSFVLFGAFMVILSAVDKIKIFVQSLVQL